VLKRKTDMLDTIANFLHQTREGWQSTDEVAAARAAAANLAAEMFAQHQVER
jgi:hypothetical protein